MTEAALPIWTEFHVERIEFHSHDSAWDTLAGLPSPDLAILHLKALGDLGHRDDGLQGLDHATPVGLFGLAQGMFP